MCPLTTEEEPDIAVHPLPQLGQRRKEAPIELVELREVEGKGVEFLIVDVILPINLKMIRL